MQDILLNFIKNIIISKYAVKTAKRILKNFKNLNLNKYIIKEKKIDVHMLGESLCINIIRVVPAKTNKLIFHLILNRANRLK